MADDRKALRLAHMEAVQGVRLPEGDAEGVLDIAESLADTLNAAAGQLLFDSEPAGFARAMAELARKK